MLFSEFGLKAGLVRSLESVGYTEATPIQEQVMKIAFSGANIVGQSQTGTGKTAAFLLPILNKIDTNKKSLQALILAPTRELVNQIGDEVRNLTKYYGVTCTCVYGGASPNVQKQKLKKNPAIIVATPGRLMDFINQKIITLNPVEYFVLDEVDMMLDMGFVRDIRKVRSGLKNVKQSYTFSATMNNDMKTIIKEHISAYEFIKIGDAVTVDKINHRYMAIDHQHKLFNAIKLIHSHVKDKVIIFTHTKRNTKTIHQALVSAKINAGLLNGNMSQGKRQSTLNEFKSNRIKVLVTTDVAARGLNMENVGLVVNFDVPIDAKSYVHRIGRTGRAGARGKAIMLVSPLERPLVKDIEKMHKIRIEQSQHEVYHDREGIYGKLRLDRSTDKKGGRRNQPPRRSGANPNKRNFRNKDRGEKNQSNSSEYGKSPVKNKRYAGKVDRKQDSESNAQRYAHKIEKRPTKNTTNKRRYKGMGK